MEKYFDLEMSFLRFARNTLVVSCIGMLPFVFLFIARTPGFGAMLLDGGPALSRFSRQIVTNGLPVVFAINYVSFLLFAATIARRGKGKAPVRTLLIDPPLRVVSFVILHGVIYFVSADWFGSFGGDRLLALRAVGPTLARSAFFENLSGAYLYATLASALPLYSFAIEECLVAARGRFTRIRNVLHGVSTKLVAVLLSLVLFAVFVLLLTGTAASLVWLQSV